ncbi:MAG: pyruvate ferredoxin oxidoreductase [Candidatus Moranbacteria bacterium]|nr:pyruvate ferredoxin oxidoreductase [Candidatus Moranbacteria bacterium]
MLTKTNKNKTDERKLTPGHTTCAGCPAPLIVRSVLDSIKYPVVVASATGCLEVATTIYPKTSWNVPFIHSAFENAAATISGAETAYRVLNKRVNKSKAQKEKFSENYNFQLEEDIKFVTFGGDGGTYDIGLQSLSGAMERGHDFLYVCYDNEGYMNTGGQRSGATPKGAGTTTTPPGEVSTGKIQTRKDLMEIVVAHNVPYAAQASIFNLFDLQNKVRKAMEIKGPKFINVLSPCPTIWKFDPAKIVELTKLAVETGFWPVYEYENGKYKLNFEPKELKPLEEFLKPQRRFAHLFKNEAGKEVLNDIQQLVNQKWKELKQKMN